MRDHRTTGNTDIDIDVELMDGAGRSRAGTQAVLQELMHTLRSREPQTAPDAAAHESPGRTGVIVGVEADRAEPTLVAHAVPDLRVLTPWLGVASCGLPVEYLTLVPELVWAEVDSRIRCPHCGAAGPSDT